MGTQWDALACAQALESNALAYAVALTEAGGGQVLRLEDAILTVLPFDYWTNGVHVPRFSPATARQRIEDILSLFRAWDLGVRFRLGPSSQPPDLARLFERPRFSRRMLPYMACPLSQARVDWPQPPGLQVHPVDDYRVFLQRPHPMYGLCKGRTPRTLLDILQELAQQRPRRHWTFVAELEGRFVASAELYVHENHVGGRGFVVLKPYRRQGIGGAMLLAMYRLAVEQEAELAVLGPSAMGRLFYPHFGFQYVGHYPIFTCNRQRLRRYGREE